MEINPNKLNDEMNSLETTPEKALISSYIIKLLNRNASTKVDRLLKKEYDEVKRTPLILDTIMRAQLLAFFSSDGAVQATKDLMQYYRKYKLFSALLDAKNLLVICSKENIDDYKIPFNESMQKVAMNLIEKGKAYIIKSHIKAALASCILTGRLGEDFEKLMSESLSDESIPTELQELIIETSKECQKDLKDRILESKPINER